MANNSQVITNPNLKMINGPVNIVRMEGQINGIKKVIYLFMDVHERIEQQTQCDNIFSVDVQKYFVDNFSKLNSNDMVYDFFVEIRPSELSSEIYKNKSLDYKDIYIEEVVKLFTKTFKFDSKKNKVKINKLFKNIRLHYLDIRDYYKETMVSNINQLPGLARKFMTNDSIGVHTLGRIVSIMQNMKDYLEFIVDVLDQTPAADNRTVAAKPKIIKNIVGLDEESIYYLANKMKNSYKYPIVKKSMNKLINLSVKNFSKTIKNIDESSDRFLSYINNISDNDSRLIVDENSSYKYHYGLTLYTIRNYITDINNTVDFIVTEQFVEFFARLTDIYFLRRFLDKDYITNAIVYAGAYHINTYINVLAKDFDFNVTHVSYSSARNIKQLNKEIRTRPLVDLSELFSPVIFEQCSDMTEFPEEFL